MEPSSSDARGDNENSVTMESKWNAAPHLNDTAIWIPESGLTQIKLVRKWNSFSRLQRSIIYAALTVCLVSLGILYYDRALNSNVEESVESANNSKISIEKINETLVMMNYQDTKIKSSLIINEPEEQSMFTGATNARQHAVLNSFRHAWSNYKEYAWGRDNLLPLSTSGSDWFSLGLTIVDGLDTAYIMGLTQEFQEGRDWIAKELTFTRSKDVNLFEVTIRVLGALLANYHLAQDDMFLRKAEDLGDRLLGAFSSQSGIPYSDVNLYSRLAHAPEWSPYSSTAEVTTIQLEFRELSRATGNPKYEEAAAAVSEKIHRLPKKQGLVPIFISPLSGNFTTHATITLGARGDSYYEYLLKQWIQTGKKIDYLKEDYLAAIEGVRDLLAKRTAVNKYLFIGELTGSKTFVPKMDHLVCFLPGTLALGYANGLPSWHLQMALDLLTTCYITYASQPTFIAPEITHFHVASSSRDMYVKNADSHSLLRPEFVESLWYLYQITGNTTFQEWGWNVYQAFEKYARVDTGYCSLDGVNTEHPQKRDSMESFFLSETLKYLYLLFGDDRKLLDLSKYVINSEAHPLPVHRT